MNQQTILNRIATLEEKLDQEILREHAALERQGWGYAMRHSRIGVSTTKSDRIRQRINKLKEQLNK